MAVMDTTTKMLSNFLQRQEGQLLTFFCASAMMKYFIMSRSASRNPKKEDEEDVEDLLRPQAKLAGKVSEMYLYPIKSCRRIDIALAECTLAGFRIPGGVHDRLWVLCDDKGVYVSAKNHPKLVLVDCSFHGNTMRVNVDGMPTLTLPLDGPSKPAAKLTKLKMLDVVLEGVDCGDEASDWFSRYLGVTCRLLIRASWMEKRLVQDGKGQWFKDAGSQHLLSFQKDSPYLLMSEETVADVNTRLPDPVTTLHFRPNLVISGCTAYEEDKWSRVYIGGASFKKLKLMQRCPVTTIDPETGVMNKSGEPLATLQKYRHVPKYKKPNPSLCLSLVLEKPGTVRVGDPVYVIEGQSDYDAE